jgi:predicted MFS family arabinose efflux permease
MVPRYASGGMRGTAYGIYYLIVGLAFFVSNAIVGWLWNSYGSFIAATYSISTTALSLVLMGFFLRDDSREG